MLKPMRIPVLPASTWKEVNGDGGYEVRMDFQTQWMNNKGPAKLELVKVMVYVFNEERIETQIFTM